MDTFIQDFRLAIRRLVKAPAFVVVASLSLAIGIGANTAAFAVMHAVLLRTLPVEDPAALAVVKTRYNATQYSMPHPAFLALRDHSSSVDVIAFRATAVNVSTGAATERVTGMLVSGNYFNVLGVSMSLGTPIEPDDDRAAGGSGPRGIAAVISHSYWMKEFHGDPNAVGRVIRVHGRPATIVGVSSRGFNGTATGSIADVYLPMTFASVVWEHIPNWLTNPRSNWIRLMARLKPGATLATAEADMTLVLQRHNRAFVLPLATTDAQRDRARNQSIVLEPGNTGLFELGTTLRTSMYVLMGLVGLVFLITCINVANLVVGRAERQQRDTAIAVALGASTARLLSQYLAESLLIGAAGVILGLLSSAWIRDALVQLIPEGRQIDVSMDPQVFAVSVALGVSTALALSTMTVWRATRLGVAGALKGDDLVSRLWLRKGLIVGQLALSIVVLVTASLFVRTLDRLQQVNPGFERERGIIASFAYGALSKERRTTFIDRMIEAMHATPGVVSAAFSDHEPLGLTTFWNIQPATAAGPTMPSVSVRVDSVTPGYFKTLGIPLILGRDIQASDSAPNAPSVVVVNEAAAARVLGTRAIGERIATPGATYEVVGVVKNTATDGLRETGIPVIYVPGGGGVLVVRSAMPPRALAASIRAAASRLEPDVPVFNVRTMSDQIGRFLDRERTFANLSIAFGALAALLSAVGLYAVIANAVSRRTRELGIRLALGAAPEHIRRLVLREAAWLVAIGIIAGLPAAYATGRLIASSLFEVNPGDPGSAAVSVAILIAVAVVSAWLPARRASKVDPLIALRSE